MAGGLLSHGELDQHGEPPRRANNPAGPDNERISNRERMRTMATDSTIGLKCRCCGKAVPPMDSYPIHTACIPKHWDRHAHGVNASRCREFGREAETV